MKCIIPGPNVKVFAKAIHALSKIGDEMYVQPQENGISFRTVNLANSAYADFTFQENFFSYYLHGNVEDEDVQKCKISMRSAISVFKTPNVLDKQVESCHVKLNSEVDELLFLLKYKNGISKTYIVPILDSGKLKVTYKKDDAQNKVSCQPKVLTDALQIFNQTLIEITVEVLPQKMILRNYTDDASSTSHITRTQLALAVGEFEEYGVSVQTALTFCLKELKAMLGFAESAGVSLNMNFEIAGKPIVFVLKDTAFEANLVLATVNLEGGTQTETTVTGKKEACNKRNTGSRGNKRSAKSFRKGASERSARSKVFNNSTAKNKNLSVQTITERSINTNSSTVEQITDHRGRLGSDKNTSRNNDQLNDGQATIPALNSSRLFSSAATSSANTSLHRENINTSVHSTSMQTSPERNGADVGRSVTTSDDNLLLDCIPSSPPPVLSKKARMIFKKCFQQTFDPRMLPGHDEVLVEASDEEC